MIEQGGARERAMRMVDVFFDFTSEYPEQQGASGTTFTFDTTIVNNRATEQSYALAADVPTGWQATFTPSGETTNVASLTVDAGQSQGVTVTVTPPFFPLADRRSHFL